MIALVVIVIGACVAGSWLFFARHASTALQAASSSRASDFFKAPPDYKTTGGQTMKPRW